jgi:hypothetical protein
LQPPGQESSYADTETRVAEAAVLNVGNGDVLKRPIVARAPSGVSRSTVASPGAVRLVHTMSCPA